MGLLKKNLVFSVVVLISILAFIAGAYLAFAESGKVGEAERKISSAKTQLSSVLNADPAPTEPNIEASAKNVAELTEQLKSIRTDLEQGSRLSPSSDGIQVTTSIQQFITDFQSKARNNLRDDEEAAPVTLPDNFAFGFEQYIDETQIPDDPKVVPVLDKQRQILSYLLNKLLDANPHGIVSVKREVVERKRDPEAEQGRNRETNQGFVVNSAISARVPGAIETLGFSLTFTGYTDSLREFLNSLSKFDLPIVVRSIQVDRTETRAVNRRPERNTNSLDSIFGSFGGGAEADAEPAQEAQTPVIAENVSSFTVILEFIEIILPEEAEEENL